MTIQPVAPPHLLTVAEYLEIGEIELGYSELVEGRLLIVDLTEPVSLLVCHLAGEFGYADGGAVTGVFGATEPFGVEIDLDALR